MHGNAFKRISGAQLTAGKRGGETILSDVAFTAPYKIMQPFRQRDGGIKVMLLAASAGIMEGDRQSFKYHVLEGAKLEMLSQAYEKIHKMEQGCAKRETKASVAAGATFMFCPQPTIPFKDSAFENETYVDLQDETSAFIMSEILSCGRVAMGEEFAYRRYYSLTQVRRAGKLIYRDNTRYEPDLYPMDGLGMYEGYTHLLNMFATRPRDGESFFDTVAALLSEEEEKSTTNEDDAVEGGITRTKSGDFAVRLFGKRAQRLEDISQKIQDVWASCAK